MLKDNIGNLKKKYPRQAPETAKGYLKRLVKQVISKDLQDSWLDKRPPEPQSIKRPSK